MRSFVVVVVVLVAVACADNGIVSAGARPEPAFRLSPHEGNGQRAEVGSILPNAVRVRVTDVANGGVAVPGQLLLWIVSKGAGTVALDTTRTDADGYSSQYWTLGTFATDDSLDIWMLSPSGRSVGSTSVGATALHGAALPGAQKCDPIAFSLEANVAIPIVDSVQVYARDRFNNVWPTTSPVSVQDVRFSGRVDGNAYPVASHTARTITLAPSGHDGPEGTNASWQGGWIVTLRIDEAEQASCTIGASAK